ncbi:hypothetical protein JL720_15516 [Aureococcus anophagefferens]|nr:hypothetical protein JL720_15516 [Aureococcus anophagefferens]
MMPLSRRLLITSALFMFLTALTGAVFRWIGAARDLRAKKLDVAPPFERAVPGPYAVRGSGSALEVCYGAKHRSNTATVVVDAFVADVTVTAAGNGTRSVVRADELTATYAFGRGARALFARGSPYVTVELDRGADVELGSARASPVVAGAGGRVPADTGGRGPPRACAAHEGCGGLSGDCCPAAEGVFLECCGGGWRRLAEEATGRSFALTLGDGARWLLFASADVSLAKAGASWRLRAPTDVVARLAYAPDRASEELLVAHAGTYAVGGRVSWAARGDAAVLRFRWATRTFDGAPLLGAKRDILAALKTVADVAPDGLDERDLAERTGVYTSGKRLFRLANVALTARAAGDDETGAKWARKLAKALRPWLATGKRGLLVTTATSARRSGYKDPEADFGNGRYNDHHFHYGYLVYAAAVAAHLGETVDRAAVDASCPTSPTSRRGGGSPRLPIRTSTPRSSRVAAFARHKDAYDGHSWASGLFSLADGKSQESVSEALPLRRRALGRRPKDPELRDFGRLLLALEARAGRAYWHVDEANVYGGAFAAANVVVGVVGAGRRPLAWFERGGLLHPHQRAALHARVGGAPRAAGLRRPGRQAALAGLPTRRARARRAESGATSAASPATPTTRSRGPGARWASSSSPSPTAPRPTARSGRSRRRPPPALDATQSLPALLYWASTRPDAAPPTPGAAAARAAADAATTTTAAPDRRPRRIDGAPAPTAPALRPRRRFDGGRGRRRGRRARPATGATASGSDAPDSPAACAAHAGCAALTGDCCPTAAGVALGCCDDRR